MCIRNLVSLFLLGVCLITAVEAAPKDVRVDFHCLAWDRSQRRSPIGFTSSGKLIGIDQLNDHSQTAVQYTYIGPPLIHFYNSTEYRKNPAVPPIGSYQVRPEDRELLLVFIPLENGRIKVVGLSHDWKSFPKKSFRLMNMTDGKLAVLIDSKKVLLSPHEMESGALQSSGGLSFEVKIAAKTEKNPARLVYSNRWTRGTDRRFLCFITEVAGAKKTKLHVKVISDGPARKIHQDIDPADYGPEAYE